MTSAALYAAVKAAADARSVKIASIRTARAQWATICPQCKAPLSVGSEIAQPDTRNRESGRVYIAVWYCPACAIRLAAEGQRTGGVWLSQADLDAHYEWMVAACKIIDDATKPVQGQA